MDGDTPIIGFLQVAALWKVGEKHTFSIDNKYAIRIGGPRVIHFSNSARRTVTRKTVSISTLGESGLRLKSPLALHIEQAGEEVLAYSYDLEELEVAAEEWQVIERMRAAIADTYFLLKSERDNLGPTQQKHWDFLKQITIEA